MNSRVHVPIVWTFISRAQLAAEWYLSIRISSIFLHCDGIRKMTFEKNSSERKVKKENSLSIMNHIPLFFGDGGGGGSPNTPMKLTILLHNVGIKAAESVLNLKSTTTSSLQGSIASYHKEHTNTPTLKSLASFFTNLPPFSSALDRN